MTTNQWHFAKDGQVKGPYDDEQFRALCESGTINAATYVWRPNYPDWVRLAESDFRYKSTFSQPPAAPRPAPSAATTFRTSLNDPTSDDYNYNYEVEDLSLLQYFLRGLFSKYVDFHGRARRKEYWGFMLFYFLAIFTIAAIGLGIDAAVGNIESGNKDMPIVLMSFLLIYVLGTFLPRLAILARRLHDINVSAWFILLILFLNIFSVGWIIEIIMTVLSSYPGRNKYGPSPVGPKLAPRNYA